MIKILIEKIETHIISKKQEAKNTARNMLPRNWIIRNLLKNQSYIVRLKMTRDRKRPNMKRNATKEPKKEHKQLHQHNEHNNANNKHQQKDTRKPKLITHRKPTSTEGKKHQSINNEGNN